MKAWLVMAGAIFGISASAVSGTYALKPLDPPNFPKNPSGGTI